MHSTSTPNSEVDRKFIPFMTLSSCPSASILIKLAYPLLNFFCSIDVFVKFISKVFLFFSFLVILLPVLLLAISIYDFSEFSDAPIFKNIVELKFFK